MDIEVKTVLIILLVLLFLFIVLDIIFNVLIGFAINSEKKSNKRIEYYKSIKLLNEEYKKLIIPNLKRLIVKLGKDIPLTKEEQEMLEDIIMESNKND